MTQIQNGTTPKRSPIEVDGKAFALVGPQMHYRLHVDADGELIHDHFGTPAPHLAPSAPVDAVSGWSTQQSDEKRELPDTGRGDFRVPALHIKTGAGHCVTAFKYAGHEVVAGKPGLDGLPATFGGVEDVSTLVVRLEDAESGLVCTLRYSVFPGHNAVARSYTITNGGDTDVEIRRAASFTLNLDAGEWDMVQLSGDWGREANQSRRPVAVGTQGFQSLAGFSSPFFNPFVGVVGKDTTENRGVAYGLSLVYSGSFEAQVEQYVSGRVRAQIGMNPLHLDWRLAPGESFTTPECVAVFSDHGIGGMSRALHGLFRAHLLRSSWARRERPFLLNMWEGLYFDIDAEKLVAKAQNCVDVGVKLYVMDDGWFGDKHPRVDERAGLGDWVVNPKRFPDGLGAFVDRINSFKTTEGEPLRFGIWVEPEMVNPNSELYERHPDWVLHAGNHVRTEQRNQLVLDLSKREVQDYLIKAIGDVLASANIAYVKWDNNRAMHEVPSPSTPHAYMLGLYRVLDTLTTRFPAILFEGCASGGSRFDPGLLHYWPQNWASDNSDALDRLHIQFGTTLVYPPSTMGCHISAVPNHQVHRTTPLEFRVHVALMGGSPGFELDLDVLPPHERDALPAYIRLAEKVNPYIIHGDQYRLALPGDSNWPAVLYVAPQGDAVLLAYQMAARVNTFPPVLHIDGLDTNADYEIDGKTYAGAALKSAGLKLKWEERDYQSKVLFINRV